MKRVLKNEFYHKFRRFDTLRGSDGSEQCVEVDGMYSMRVGDYIRYLEKRQLVLEEQSTKDTSFSFANHEGNTDIIENVGVSALYKIDLDVEKLMPKVYSNFKECFRCPELLPGGAHCMMNSVRFDFISTLNARFYPIASPQYIYRLLQMLAPSWARTCTSPHPLHSHIFIKMGMGPSTLATCA